jgi:adenine deaminase
MDNTLPTSLYRQATTLTGHIVDPLNNRMYSGTISCTNSIITAIEEHEVESTAPYIMPGFIDAHIHVESSMLIPSEFARMAVVHGTVGTISDPHEIANVLGIEGVRYMIANSKHTPMKICFGAPSCVPATTFETAGAVVSADDIRALFEQDNLLYLSEMMNYPGVLFADTDVMKKIAIAHELQRPVDGHAPGLRGEQAKQYEQAGITTDHECFTLDEALDKLAVGMKILIREGSAAKNFSALESLISSHTESVMLCSDDKHPNELVVGHINEVVRRAIKAGHGIMNVLRCACVNPVLHYKMPVGLLRVGDPMDCTVIDTLENFTIRQTWIDGQLVAEHGVSAIPRVPADEPNNFYAEPIKQEQLRVLLPSTQQEQSSVQVRVIKAFDGQLITEEVLHTLPCVQGEIQSLPAEDILKIVVVNRYKNTQPVCGFIKNIGLQRGAIASCVAHDSHNIIAVGTNDTDLCNAINVVIHARGGISIADGAYHDVLPLPVAGIMSADEGVNVAQGYERLDRAAKALGSPLSAPYMTLSFMGLLVIPALKMSDLGLFDGSIFRFTEVVVE